MIFVKRVSLMSSGIKLQFMINCDLTLVNIVIKPSMMYQLWEDIMISIWQKEKRNSNVTYVIQNFQQKDISMDTKNRMIINILTAPFVEAL